MRTKCWRRATKRCGEPLVGWKQAFGISWALVAVRHLEGALFLSLKRREKDHGRRKGRG